MCPSELWVSGGGATGPGILAMWRRIVRIPMENQVPEAKRDVGLKKRLSNPDHAEPAILAWAVKGFAKWHEAGKLIVPPILKEATTKYREAQDPIEQFISDECEREPDAITEASVLFYHWQQWCKNRREIEPGSKKAFGAKLEAKSFPAVRDRMGLRARKGLRISEAEG